MEFETLKRISTSNRRLQSNALQVLSSHPRSYLNELGTGQSIKVIARIERTSRADPLVAPISGRPCLAYRLLKPYRDGWQTVAVSAEPFALLRDPTEAVHIPLAKVVLLGGAIEEANASFAPQVREIRVEAGETVCAWVRQAPEPKQARWRLHANLRSVTGGHINEQSILGMCSLQTPNSRGRYRCEWCGQLLFDERDTVDSSGAVLRFSSPIGTARIIRGEALSDDSRPVYCSRCCTPLGRYDAQGYHIESSSLTSIYYGTIV